MTRLAPIDRSHIAPVTTREELIYLLSRACELEHGTAALYLKPFCDGSHWRVNFKDDA